MRSYAYTDFIKNDIPEVNYFDFYVPYEPGSHLESMDKVLYSIKLGNKQEISPMGKATAMVGFWYEQVSMRWILNYYKNMKINVYVVFVRKNARSFQAF